MNNLDRQIIDEGLNEFELTKKEDEKMKKEEAIEKAARFYEGIVDNVNGWAREWVMKKYEIWEENFTPDLILERSQSTYHFMHAQIEKATKQYLAKKN